MSAGNLTKCKGIHSCIKQAFHIEGEMLPLATSCSGNLGYRDLLLGKDKSCLPETLTSYQNFGEIAIAIFVVC